MANPVQMAVDVFWAQIQKLERLSRALRADLEADKQRLTELFSGTRNDANPAQAAQNQALLKPQIHRNSQLRLRYRDLAAAFNRAVAGARASLERAGYTVPAGLGAVQLAVPLVAVAALGTAFLIYQSIRTATDAQRTATRALARIISDPNATAEEKKAAAAALAKTAATPPGDFMGQIAPILGLVALIMVLPAVLPGRKAAA